MASITIRGTLALLVAVGACQAGAARASSLGRDSSQGSVNCNNCHAGGTTPSVDFAGDATLLRGTTRTYEFVIETGGILGGLNVAESSGSLSLGVGGFSSANTKLSAGEITHSSPRNFVTTSNRVFTFTLTAAAGAPCNTPASLTGWGLAADGANGPAGDRAAQTQFALTIVCPPTLTTNASDDITLGAGTLTDTAVVTGRSDPVSGASIDFRLYGPDDADCSRPPVFQSLDVPYPAQGGSVTSNPYTPVAAGTYRWRATYSGDANNPLVAGACNDPGESVVVRKANPAISTNASAGIVLGAGQVNDVATVTGRVNPVGPAHIDFRLYGPLDANCSLTPAFQSLDVPYPNGGGAVASGAFTPTAAGTYRWRAFYSGDANNNAVAGACNAANENVVVAKATPTISTQASAPVTLGAGQLTDRATVTGRVNPLANTVDFELYGPDDANCASPPVFVSSGVPYNALGGATSAPFTPTAAGVYRWRAFYSGDVNNNAVSGPCNAPNENVTVSATPTLTTMASPAITLGQGQVSDTATVTGLFAPQPGATVDFRLHGPGDTDCTALPVFVSLGRPLTGANAVSDPFTPTSAGIYRWRASYSGDANNAPVTAPCNAPNESVTVAPATPTIETTASPDVALGGQVFDTATVSGRVNPQPSATIDFHLYGPLDASCAGAPIFTSTGRPQPQANGPVTSESFTPTATGTYRWRAFYSGDANNAPVSGPCNAPNESVTVTEMGALLSDGFE